MTGHDPPEYPKMSHETPTFFHAMPLTSHKPLAIKLQMNVFATGIIGDLRIVLTVLSVSNPNGTVESFFLGFYDETNLTNGVVGDHISVPSPLARSIVPSPNNPNSSGEHEQVLDVVLQDPAILAQIQQLAVSHPLIGNISNAVAALNTKTQLQNFIPNPAPNAQQPPVVKSKSI
jgi:hypothetical protein